MDFYACMASPLMSDTSTPSKHSTASTASTASTHSTASTLAALQQQHTALRDQHEKLKKHFASLTETVQVLGDQSSQTTRVAQQAQESKLDMIGRESKLQEQLKQVHSSKLELSQRHSCLQEQFNKLKVTAQTLSQNCKAADETLFLQNQLHADKLRLVEVTQNTLKDRCRAISVSAEQHRLANSRLEEQNKSISKDLEQLTELKGSGLQSLVSAKDRVIQTLQGTLQAERVGHKMGENEIASLQSRVGSHVGEIQLLTDSYTDELKSKGAEILSLKSKVEKCKQLQAKLNASNSLLSKHPIDQCLNTKTKTILLSSAEILELAHSRDTDMEKCLGQVADALRDLDGQLDSHRGLSQAWLDQVNRLV
jgi:chromosome segregation ATPase